MKLTQNTGPFDRVARFGIGIVLAAAIVTGTVTGGLALLAGALGIIMVATALTGFCPIYALLGIRTCPIQRT